MCNNHNCGCCHNHFEYCTPMYNLYSWNTKYPTYCAVNTNSNVTPTQNIVDQINAKQDKLVSGQNIKTINGISILGEGNIQISGGSGSSSGSTVSVSVTRLSDGTLRLNF